MDAAEYRHVVFGLIFLKYISDAFEEQYAKLIDISAYGQESNHTTWRLTHPVTHSAPFVSDFTDCLQAVDVRDRHATWKRMQTPRPGV